MDHIPFTTHIITLQIMAARSSRSIIFYEEGNTNPIHSINVLTQATINGRQLSFTTSFNFAPQKNYHILIDEGNLIILFFIDRLVNSDYHYNVGIVLATQYCNLESQGVTDINFWTFSFGK